MSFVDDNATALELATLRRACLAAEAKPVHGLLTNCFLGFIDRLGFSEKTPLVEVGMKMAADAEKSSLKLAYHNPRHTHRVLMAYDVITQAYDFAIKSDRSLPQLSPELILIGASAILKHDYGHDGKPNGNIPFRLERKAVLSADDDLRQAHMGQPVRDLYRALVFATEPSIGRPAVAAALRLREQLKPVQEGHFPPEMNILRSKSALLILSSLILDADIFESVVMGLRFHVNTSRKVAAELGKEATPQMSEAFLGKFAPDGLMSPVKPVFATAAKALRNGIRELTDIGLQEFRFDPLASQGQGRKSSPRFRP